MIKKTCMRALSILVCSTLVAQLFLPMQQVYAASQEEEQKYAQQLAAMDKQYPQGAFTFETAQINAEEGQTTQLVILRQGETSQEATVHFKAVDVSAQYSLDYLLTVKEGFIFSKTLAPNPNSDLLIQQYENDMVVTSEDSSNAASESTSSATSEESSSVASEVTSGATSEESSSATSESSSSATREESSNVASEATSGATSEESSSVTSEPSSSATNEESPNMVREKSSSVASEAASSASSEESSSMANEAASSASSEESSSMASEAASSASSEESSSVASEAASSASSEESSSMASEAASSASSEEPSSVASEATSSEVSEESSSVASEATSSLSSEDSSSVTAEESPSLPAATEEKVETYQDDTQPDNTESQQVTGGLHGAVEAFTGESVEKSDWKELSPDSEEYALQQQAQEEISNQLEEFAKQTEGVEYTFTFKPGEYKKVIDLDLLKDGISESEEQAVFLLYDVQGGELGDLTTAYLNIQDIDEVVDSLFAFADTDVYVSREDDSVSLTVQRTQGDQRMGAVVATAVEGTAKETVDFAATSQELFFVQGTVEKTFDIPLKVTTETDEELTFTVSLQAMGGAVDESKAVATVHILPQQSAVALANASNPAVSSYQLNNWISTNGMNTVCALGNYDLSTAEKVIVYFDNNGGYTTGTHKDGCDTVTDYYYDRKVTVSAGTDKQEVVYRQDKYQSASQSITIKLSDASKQNNAGIYVSLNGVNGNRNATLTVKKIEIYYTGYTFTLENATSANITKNPAAYTPIQYYLDNQTSQKEKAIVLGQISFADMETNKTSVVCYNGSKPNITATYSGATNMNGVAATEETVKFNGLRLRNGDNYSDLIQPEDLAATKEFVDKYKAYLGKNNTFTVVADFEPRKTTVFLAQAEDGYSYVMGGEKLLSCTMMDSVWVEVIPQEAGKATKEFFVGEVQKSAPAGTYNEKRAQKLSQALRNNMEPNVAASSNESCYIRLTLSGNYPENAKVDSKNPNRACIIPRSKDTFVYPITTEYDVTVMAQKEEDGYTNYITMEQDGEVVKQFIGTVLYQDSQGQIKTGTPEDPLVLGGLSFGDKVNLSGVTVDGYRVIWTEMTGDKNGDQELDPDEIWQLEGYQRLLPVNSANLQFQVTRPGSLLMYSFEKVSSSVTGSLKGTIYLNNPTVFGEQTNVMDMAPSERPHPTGVQVLADGESTLLDENGQYNMSKKGWNPTDYLFVSAIYQGVTYGLIQNPRQAAQLVIDATKPIDVVDGSAKIYQKDGDSWKEINYSQVTNGDHEYMIQLQATSSEANVYPTTATFALYDSNGIQKYEKTVNQTVLESDGNKIENSRLFQFTFNPKDLELQPGLELRVTFGDQYGNQYIERPLGFSLKPALSTVSFLNTMGFSSTVSSMIGTVGAIFDLGWAGDLDNSEYVSGGEFQPEEIGAEPVQTKTLAIGFNFSKNTEKEKAMLGLEASANKLAKANEAYAQAKKELQDLKNSGASEQVLKEKQAEVDQKQKAYSTAQDSYDGEYAKDKDGKSTKVDMAFNASISVETNLAINLYYDPDATVATGSTGAWYFHNMVLSAAMSADAAGSVTITTPIGLSIVLTTTIGLGNANSDDTRDMRTKATMSITEGGYERFYIAQPDTAASDVIQINLFDQDSFDFAGVFNVTPYIKLEGSVGYSALQTSIGGDVSALFNLNFYTDPAIPDYNTLEINGGITLQILGYKKRWDLGTSVINLDSSSSYAAQTMQAMQQDLALYDSIDSLQVDSQEYLQNQTAWNSAPMLARAQQDFSEQVLKNGVYKNPDVQFAALDGNRVLAVFLDAVPGRSAVNNAALYYSIYDGGVWSQPVIIQDDGTLDASPTLTDLGDRGVMVAWSNADAVMDDSADVIDVLSSQNISTALFDKTSLSFGEVKQATMTTEEDHCADVEPSITYYRTDDGQERMLMYYSKNEYTRTLQDDSEDGVLGDALHPYSLMAYLYYDFDNDCWKHTYDADDPMHDDANWYGQGFLNMAPAVNIDEKLDEEGYWTQEPTITENTSSTSALVVDSDVITYNGLALFAVVLDRDTDTSTTADREIYFQIYDYEDDSFTHPAQITSNNEAESGVKFVRGGDETFLSWISDSKIQVLDLGAAVRGGALKKQTTSAGQAYYYLDKTKGNGYIPPATIASYEDTAEAQESGNANVGKAIADYDIQTNGDEIYVLWTENGLKQVATQDEQQPWAFMPESQIYAARYTVATGQWSGRSTVTSVPGSYYTDMDFMVQPDGSLLIMSKKNGLVEETTNGQMNYTMDENATSLVSMQVVPSQKAEILGLTVEGVKEGEPATATVTVGNTGFVDLENAQFTVTDQTGAIVYSETLSMPSGTEAARNFNYTLESNGAEINEWELTAQISQNGTVVSEAKAAGSLSAHTDIASFEVNQENRNQATAQVTVVNQSGITAPAHMISLQTGDKQLAQLEVPALAPGQSVSLEQSIQLTEDMFQEWSGEEGFHAQRAVFTISDGDQQMQDVLQRQVTEEAWQQYQSLQQVEINGGKGLVMTPGQYLAPQVLVQTDETDGMEELRAEKHGVQLIWVSEDPDVAAVSSTGMVAAQKEGTTTLRALVVPADGTVVFSGGNLKNVQQTGQNELDLNTLPGDVIQVKELQVTVSKSQQVEVPSNPGDGNSQSGDESSQPDSNTNQSGGSTNHSGGTTTQPADNASQNAGNVAQSGNTGTKRPSSSTSIASESASSESESNSQSTVANSEDVTSASKPESSGSTEQVASEQPGAMNGWTVGIVTVAVVALAGICGFCFFKKSRSDK